jgi:DNA invertase Pin-like site-specific DNA recombinase
MSVFATESDSVARIVLEAVQELLLKLALQMARDDYETRRERQRQGVQLAKAAGKYAGRIPDVTTHQRIIALRGAGQSIKRTAGLAGCSESQVKRIWAIHLNQVPED